MRLRRHSIRDERRRLCEEQRQLAHLRQARAVRALPPNLQVMHSLVRVVPADLQTRIPEHLGTKPTGDLRVVMGDCVEGAGDGVITVHICS